MSIKNQIPNMLTLGNLLFGCAAIIFAFKLEFDLVILSIAFSAVLDFFDGAVASWLNVKSDIGKDLDSLADMVSFGAAPALTLYNYWLQSGTELFGYSLPLVVLALPLFAAYRLAVFNNTKEQNEYFTGLATPALAITSFSIPLASTYSSEVSTWLNHPVFILMYTIIGGLLMISSIKFYSIKLSSKVKWLNRLRIFSLLAFVVLVVIFKFFGVILCLILYLVISLTSQKRLRTL
ncbi:MAG: CDP-alcohol phosphatidyltransferase family protein [Bacteroidia bacterium]